MFVFRKICRAFSWNTSFEIRPFALLPMNWQSARTWAICCEEYVKIVKNIHVELFAISFSKTTGKLVLFETRLAYPRDEFFWKGNCMILKDYFKLEYFFLLNKIIG